MSPTQLKIKVDYFKIINFQYPRYFPITKRTQQRENPPLLKPSHINTHLLHTTTHTNQISWPVAAFFFTHSLWCSFSNHPHHINPLLSPKFPIIFPRRCINITTMLDTVLLALFLPCLGMSAIFVVYMCLLYATTRHRSDSNPPLKPVTDKGLSPLDLENLPKITGKELLAPIECAVCLDDIVDEQPARLLPGCNHAFHLQCADTWLSKHPMCPLCRAKLDPQNLKSESPCWTIEIRRCMFHDSDQSIDELLWSPWWY